MFAIWQVILGVSVTKVNRGTALAGGQDTAHTCTLSQSSAHTRERLQAQRGKSTLYLFLMPVIRRQHNIVTSNSTHLLSSVVLEVRSLKSASLGSHQGASRTLFPWQDLKAGLGWMQKGKLGRAYSFSLEHSSVELVD